MLNLFQHLIREIADSKRSATCPRFIRAIPKEVRDDGSLLFLLAFFLDHENILIGFFHEVFFAGKLFQFCRVGS